MTLPSDMDGDDNFGAEDGTDAFLKNFLPKDADAAKPSGKGKDEDESEEPDDIEAEDEDAVEPSEDDAEGDDEEDPKKRKYAEDDDTYFKIKVDDVEHEVSAKDLKRLWGQEASLTQKSQQVAEQRKVVEAEQSKYVSATAALLERAQKRFAPYEGIDFLLAAQQLSPEEYTALRNEAQAAYADVQFLQGEVDGLVKEVSNRSLEARRATAMETVKVLSGDPKDGGIEGWSDKLYDDIRSYGVSQGINQQDMNELVDASAIRLIHKAMLYDRGKSKVVTTKVNKTPKKVVKSSANPSESKARSKSDPLAKATARLKRTGSVEAAEDAFMAMWASSDD
jgi:hypothetical protein